MSTDAIALLHAATILEKLTVGQRNRREDGPYWEGAADALTWAVSTLRSRAAGFAENAADHAQLRQLATRASTGMWTVARRSTGDATLSAEQQRLGILDPAVADYLCAAQPAFTLSLLEALDDPAVPAPDITAVVNAARLVPRGAWSSSWPVLYAAGQEKGWVQFSRDIDYAVAAEPHRMLTLIRTLRTVRGA